MRQSKKSAKDYQPRCQHLDCTTKASFGYKSDRKRVSCAKHQADGMTNLAKKICEHPTCNTTASFGARHTKVSGKVYLSCTVAYTRCVLNSLGVLSSLFICALTSQERRFCAKHKLDGMENVTHNKCKHIGCTKVAAFGVDEASHSSDSALTLTSCT
jgi:EsV-1-7 cysteine-rich motif